MNTSRLQRYAMLSKLCFQQLGTARRKKKLLTIQKKISKMEKQVTYREQIQDLIEQMNHIYQAAGNLRDCATQDEKEAWNAVRKMFYSDAAAPLRKLDNSLQQWRANEKYKNYARRGNSQTEMF